MHSLKKKNFLLWNKKARQMSFFPVKKTVEHLKHISPKGFFNGDGDLVSFVSHELKTPLSTLSLALDILKEKHGKDKNHKELLQNMAEEVQWMCRFVCDMLDFQQMNNRPHSLCFQWHPFYPLMEEAKKKLAFLKKHTKITLKTPSPSVEVYMDPVFMRQAVFNLLLNALQHSSASLVELHLKFPDEGNQGGLVLQVKEQGGKVDEGHTTPPLRDLISTKFPGLKSHKVGLFFVQRIVKVHGGGLKTRAGVFEMHLPFVRKSPKQAA